jgi:hypothetical protein
MSACESHYNFKADAFMSKIDPYFKPIKIITLITCLQTILFVLFFDFSKHNAALAPLNPFIDDPFDAVGSFAIQLSSAAALLALLRILRPYPRGITLKNLALILNCNLTALLAFMVTLISDSTALIRFFPKWIDLSAGWLLAAIICGLLAVSTIIFQRILYLGWSIKWFVKFRNWPRTLAVALAAMMIMAFYLPAWRRGIAGGIFSAILGTAIFFVITALSARMIFPEIRSPYEDLVDDLGSYYVWIKQHTTRLKPLYIHLERFFNLHSLQKLVQAFNPRRHPWRLIILAALLVVAGLLLVEFMQDGSAAKGKRLLIFSIFTGIETGGVLLGYRLFHQFLGIFRN